VPQEILWQRLGATPAEIDAWKKMQAANPVPARAPVTLPPAPGDVVPAAPDTVPADTTG